MNTKRLAIFQAVMAAVCYGISVPASKILLEQIPPVMMAALLYLGAGFGMIVVSLLRGQQIKEAKITYKEMPYTIGMVVLDIAAPIFLMLGLTMANSASASLINNFEIVATVVIALCIFKEAVGKRMWIAIIMITISSIILSVDDFSNLSFSMGEVLVLLACVCWGFENNCTRMLSLKDPLQIVIIKGLCSGFGSLVIAFILSEFTADIRYIALALLLGFVSYGLSIFLYIHAQRHLGAARTSAYYAFAPFVGVGLSFLVFGGIVTTSFYVALAIMVIGTYFSVFEKHAHNHAHDFLEHEHRHNHADGHHDHKHDFLLDKEHSHLHIHENTNHTHKHTPDFHHLHAH